MLKNQDALICDFAETYHIYDYKKLPAVLVASLAAGLRENSRSQMVLAGLKAAPEFLLLAGIVDRLSWLVWSKTKDAQKGHNPPRSIMDGLVSRQPKEVSAYASGKDFESARTQIMNRLAERKVQWPQN